MPLLPTKSRAEAMRLMNGNSTRPLVAFDSQWLPARAARQAMQSDRAYIQRAYIDIPNVAA